MISDVLLWLLLLLLLLPVSAGFEYGTKTMPFECVLW
jgi:hypothetical protein